MSYGGTALWSGEQGRQAARMRRGEEVEALQVGPASTARFIAPGSLTDGQYGLFRWDMAPRAGGASAHFHRTFSESFFVLDGTVEIYDGATWRATAAGDLVHVAPGGIHGFRNASDDPAAMLILFVPGPPRERYFEELAEINRSGRRLTDEQWLDVWARHDQYPSE